MVEQSWTRPDERPALRADSSVSMNGAAAKVPDVGHSGVGAADLGVQQVTVSND
jgi:hypothetical protein